MKFSFQLSQRFLTKFKKTICLVLFLLLFVNVTMFLRHVLSDAHWKKSDKHSYNLIYPQGPTLEHYKNQSVTFGNGFVGQVYSITNRTQQRRATLEDFRNWSKTGNSLIDDYGKNNIMMAGEMGRGVILTKAEKEKEVIVLEEYKVNTIISDTIPLNRLVPDSRIEGCDKLVYDSNLPSASVIIPFYNEWLSVLLRTVYSAINRSPRHLLKEIILVDDCSTLDALHEPLDVYIENNFPDGLVRLLRMPKRLGLVNARMRGCRDATGDVLVIFDSHMEVNHGWLPPLLTEIGQDRKIVAMASLDYIQADTFEYRYKINYLTRYVWDWRLVFFVTNFRKDQIGPQTTSPRPGVTMVGTAFAIDKKYFFDIGAYDEGMKVWGGENLELSWRVWLCGGRLLHVPCSRIGHVARSQPYTFPGGRQFIEHFNYKRAVSVWMGNYSRFVYHVLPDMNAIDHGDIISRLALKTRLGCKDFSWYLRNVWPELNVPDENSTVWGEVYNEGIDLCLDNNLYLFQGECSLYLAPCVNNIAKQAFSLTTDSLLRTTLHCVVAPKTAEETEVKLTDCITGTRDKWNYSEVFPDPPRVAYKRNRNMRDLHTNHCHPDTRPYNNANGCVTCDQATLSRSNTFPKAEFFINEGFTLSKHSQNVLAVEPTASSMVGTYLPHGRLEAAKGYSLWTAGNKSWKNRLSPLRLKDVFTRDMTLRYPIPGWETIAQDRAFGESQLEGI